MRQFHSALVAAVATALAGCGAPTTNDGDATDSAGNTATVAAAAGTDPCSLVTTQEVGEVIGEPIVAARGSDASCIYETADAQASSVTIELDQGDAAGQMDIARRTAGALTDLGAQAAQEGAAGQEVNAMLSDSGGAPSIGDEAFFGANSQLSVRKGSSYLVISPPIMRSRMAAGNPMLSADDKKRMAIAIAEKAVTRLP